MIFDAIKFYTTLILLFRKHKDSDLSFKDYDFLQSVMKEVLPYVTGKAVADSATHVDLMAEARKESDAKLVEALTKAVSYNASYYTFYRANGEHDRIKTIKNLRETFDLSLKQAVEIHKAVWKFRYNEDGLYVVNTPKDCEQ